MRPLPLLAPFRNAIPDGVFRLCCKIVRPPNEAASEVAKSSLLIISFEFL